MRRFAWLWLASSLAIAAQWLGAETRPQYGGTLHIAIQSAPRSLDPADDTQPDSFGRRTLTSLLFDRLVAVDTSGHIRPELAESWQGTQGNRRWQFRIRRGVKFSDGTLLSGEFVATAVRAANPSWSVSAEGDSMTVETDKPDADLLAELALPRNAIAKRGLEREIAGTGPFQVTDWQPGKKLTLAANEDYWRGRPFVDGIELEMGRSFHDQVTALELGRADLVEVAPEQAGRLTRDGRYLASSQPIELLALVFLREASSSQEKSLRQALGLSIERGSMRSVLLQGAGQPAASLLPTWISGYGFVFSWEADLAKARQLRQEARTVPNWTVGYDGGDPLARLLAERIALNARDAGLSLQPISSGNPDLRLVRIPLVTSDPSVALASLLAAAGIPGANGSTLSVDGLYAAEQATLSTGRIIPLFHLPVSYASSPRLRNWQVELDGSCSVREAWLEGVRP